MLKTGKIKILAVSVVVIVLITTVSKFLITDAIGFKVANSNVKTAVTVTGTIKVEGDSIIAPEVTAKVIKIFFKEGSYIKEGQTIAILNKEKPQGELESAHGQLISSLNQLKNLQTEPRWQQAAIAQSQVQEEKEKIDGLRNNLYSLDIEVKNTTSEEQRLNKLYKEGAVSFRDYEKSFFAKEQAIEKLKNMQNQIDAEFLTLNQLKINLNLIKSGTKKEAINAAKGQVESSVGNLSIAKGNLNNYTIKAPFDCILIDSYPDPGEIASPTQPMFRVVKPTHLYLNAEIEENQLDNIKLGQKAEVVFDAYPEKTFNGILYHVKKSIDNTTGNFDARIKIYNPKKKQLVVGMTADANIITSSRQNALVIPSKFLVIEHSKTFVFIKDQNSAKKMPVKSAEFDNNKVLILNGLKSGETILYPYGKNKLENGKWVSIKEYENL